MKSVYKRHIYVIVFMLLCSSSIMAQRYTNGYLSMGWQYGSPISTGFTDKASGYGFYLDGGYYVNPFLSIGMFLNYHTNYEYIPRQTYSVGETGDVTTDQQHCIRQLPFGASVRYRPFTGKWQPFFGTKIGTSYIKSYSDFHTVRAYDNTWGFYISPEAGIAIYPFKSHQLGLSLSGYYSYSTNQPSVLHYDINGVNNLGFRLGLIF